LSKIKEGIIGAKKFEQNIQNMKFGLIPAGKKGLSNMNVT